MAQEFSKKYQCRFSKHYESRCSEQFMLIVRTWCRNQIDAGVRKSEIARPTSIPKSFDKKSREFGTRLFDLLAAFDICRSAVNEAVIINTRLMFSSSEVEDEFLQALVRANCSLLNYVTFNLNAILDLVLNDNDLPARILVRSVSEAADTLLACQFDLEFSKKYVESTEDFSTFWYKNLRPKELSKMRRVIWKKQFNLDQETVERREERQSEEYSVFSEAAHPSYEAGIFEIYKLVPADNDPDFEIHDNWFSERSVTFLIDKVALPVAKIFSDLRTSNVGGKLFSQREHLEQDARFKAHLGGAFAALIMISLHGETYE